MDSSDDVRLREGEKVVVALKRRRPLDEPLAAISGLIRSVPLDRRAHRAVDHHDPLAQRCRQFIGAVRTDVWL